MTRMQGFDGNCTNDSKCSAHTDLDALAVRLGVVRNKRIMVPCSGCAIACHPVSPLDCFCVCCVEKQMVPDKTADNTRTEIMTDKLPIEEIVKQIKEIDSKIKELKEQKDTIREKCSHKYQNGEKATYACGGGSAWCRYCETEID